MTELIEFRVFNGKNKKETLRGLFDKAKKQQGYDFCPWICFYDDWLSV